ncbi:MAG: acyltransferase [Myxococcales bacterium]
MRREHHPYWAEKLLGRFSELYAEHFLLPMFDRVGAEPRFQGPRHIILQGPNIRVGDHFHAFGTASSPVSFSVNPYDGGEGAIDIGNYCVISSGVRIRSAVGVSIGDNCMLAENVYVTDADWHDLYHRIYPGTRKPVRIGNNVWLAESAHVMKGVTIGDNSVVGARSLVVKDIPENSIAAGNPARVIGEIDPDKPRSLREHLFAGGRPYREFKDEYDRQRLAGNTFRGWMKALLWPDERS